MLKVEELVKERRRMREIETIKNQLAVIEKLVERKEYEKVIEEITHLEKWVSRMRTKFAMKFWYDDENEKE